MKLRKLKIVKINDNGSWLMFYLTSKSYPRISYKKTGRSSYLLDGHTLNFTKFSEHAERLRETLRKY